MVVRRQKKSIRQLGKRTRHGNKKNWRGKGSRGGKGRAGSQKQKRNTYQHLFGKKIRMTRKTPVQNALNLKDLDQLLPNWIALKLVEKNAQGQYVIDGKKLGIDKVLGGGETEHEYLFVNVRVSKAANDKLEGTEFEESKSEEAK